MGSRGQRAEKSGASSPKDNDPMNVPFDEWGKMIDNEPIRDERGDTIGYIKDEYRYVQEPDIHPVTKKEVLDDINAWRGDDGAYGDEDTKIYFAYKDGTVVDADDLDGKAYKKSGIIGASISTPDYEMVWGGEIWKGELHQWTTWEDPDSGVEGKPNSYSGYKTVGVYKTRKRVTFNNPNGKGGYKAKHEIIRKSAIKPWS